MTAERKISGEYPFANDAWDSLVEEAALSPLIPGRLRYVSADPRNTEYSRRRVLLVVAQFTALEVRKLLPFLENQQVVDIVERHIKEAEENPQAEIKPLPEGSHGEILKVLMQDYNWDPDKSLIVEQLMKQHSKDEILAAINVGLETSWLDVMRASMISHLLGVEL